MMCVQPQLWLPQPKSCLVLFPPAMLRVRLSIEAAALVIAPMAHPVAKGILVDVIAIVPQLSFSSSRVAPMPLYLPSRTSKVFRLFTRGSLGLPNSLEVWSCERKSGERKRNRGSIMYLSILAMPSCGFGPPYLPFCHLWFDAGIARRIWS